MTPASFGGKSFLLCLWQLVIFCSLTGLLTWARPALADGDATVELYDGTNKGFGFEHLGPIGSDGHNLHVTLQGGTIPGTGQAYDIYYSDAYDPNGAVFFESTDNFNLSPTHNWDAQGANSVHAETDNRTVFSGALDDPQTPMNDYYSFGAAVTHLDADLEDNGYDPYGGGMGGGGMGGMFGYSELDDQESVDGVEIPITDPDLSSLPASFPSGENGHAFPIELLCGYAGELEINTGAGTLAVYHRPVSTADWQRVDAPIPYTPGTALGSFAIHTSNQFSGSVTIDVIFNHDPTQNNVGQDAQNLKAKDVVLAMAPPPIPLIDSITSTEKVDGSATSNSLTVSGITLETLYLTENAGAPEFSFFQVEVNLPANNPPDRADCRFKIIGNDASPNFGNFAGGPQLIQIQAGGFCEVAVGIDDDNDGVLQIIEYDHKHLVEVIDFSESVVKAQGCGPLLTVEAGVLGRVSTDSEPRVQNVGG